MLARPRMLATASLCCYSVLVVGIFLIIWHKTGGHFCYALDDPYIHLALAERIAHGFYGINVGEASSPSSSILWPFLLVPFAESPLQMYLPLLWNVLCGAISAWLIGITVAEWPVSPEHERPAARVLAAMALVLICNLAGAPFVGMEHGLQVLLAIACACGICRVMNGRPMPAWSILAAAIAPMVRYEDLVLTLAIGAVLAAERRWKTLTTLVATAMTPLIAFSIYLRHRGLPGLPLSVMVKGNVSTAHTNVAIALIKSTATNASLVLGNAQRWPLVALCGILAFAALQERRRVRRFALAGAATATLLTLLIVRLGSLHRYEYFAMSLAAIVSLQYLWSRGLPSLTWLVLGLLALAMPYARTLPAMAQSASDIYGQQYQMHRFATDFYRGNVAVGDLGFVSYGIGQDRYVLDVSGLASLEVARTTDHSPAWLEAVAQEHNVGLVMIFPPVDPPPHWTPIGILCLAEKPTEVAGQCVNFYATRPIDAPALKQAFKAFAKTLPPQSYAVSPLD